MNEFTDKEILDELEKRFSKKEKAMKELHELTLQLTELNRQLERSESVKGHFLSNIRNEIINPFSAIIGLSGSLMTSDKDDVSHYRKVMTLIYSEAFHLNFQLRNIFAAAEIEAGDAMLKIDKVDVKSVIDNTIDSLKFFADKKRITIEQHFNYEDNNGDFSFFTDQDKLQLILSNIISNAVQFSYDNSRVVINTLLTPEMLKVSVKDSGIGISHENQKIIFDRFSKVDGSINTLNKGHGLGLSVSKDYTELLNGSISLSSNPAEGSEFEMLIPSVTGYENNNTLATDGNSFFFESNEIF